MKLKNKNKTKDNSSWKGLTFFLKTIFPQFIAGIFVFSLFLIIVDFYEYLTTEQWWIQDSINYAHTAILLFFMIALAALLNWKKIITDKKVIYFIILLTIFTLFAHQKYSDLYEKLQSYPRIKKISHNSGIQGSLVRITGRNFGEPFEAGKVIIGNETMNIRKWSDKEIIFEVPVYPKPGKYNIYIETNRLTKTDFFYELKGL